MKSKNQTNPVNFEIKLAGAYLRDNKDLISEEYDDVYFSIENGYEETLHVFLKGNELPNRWGGKKNLTVGELGFGTGLNFLCTWELFNQVAEKDQQLIYYSCEKHPLDSLTISLSLERWPHLTHLKDQLLNKYAPSFPGYHEMIFQDGRVRLVLMLGDVIEQLSQLQGQIDTWFLDGFSPAKNPDMWSEGVFNKLFSKSSSGASLSTYTAAGWIRRNMEKSGFTVQKMPGFGRKREMIQASKSFSPKSIHISKIKIQKAIVIGAGLAGTAVANALARRDWEIKVIDRNSNAGSEASGNPVGVVMPRITATPHPISRISLQADLLLHRHLESLKAKNIEPSYDRCGVVQLAFEQKHIRRLQTGLKALGLPENYARWLNPEEVSKRLGFSGTHPGIYFPNCGWVVPPELCESNLKEFSNQIELISNTEVSELNYENNNSENPNWIFTDQEGRKIGESTHVVLANGNEALKLIPEIFLPLIHVRGQLAHIRSNSVSESLRHIITYNGYCTPMVNGKHVIGSTYHPDNADLELSQQDHESILSLLNKTIPELNFSTDKPEGRVAFRTTTPDHLPVIGPIPDLKKISLSEFPEKKMDQKKYLESIPYLNGLYISVAHGSRGILSSVWSAEIVASLMNREPLPTEHILYESVWPNRFVSQYFKSRGI